MPDEDSSGNELSFSRSVREVRSYSGPIPSADEIARYEEVLPGSADRLISMAEREQVEIVSFRNKALVAATLVAIVTISAIAFIVSMNPGALIPLLLAAAQALPAITDFLRGRTDNQIAKREHELDIQIRKERHELDMLAARRQLSLPPGEEEEGTHSLPDSDGNQ